MILIYVLVSLIAVFKQDAVPISADCTQREMLKLQDDGDSLRRPFFRSIPFIITDTIPQSGKWSGYLVDCLHGCFLITADLVVNSNTKELTGRLIISALSLQEMLDTSKTANKDALEGLFFPKDEEYSINGYVTTDSIYFNIDSTIVTTRGIDRIVDHYGYRYRGRSIRIDNPRYWEVLLHSLPRYSISGEYESTNLLLPRLKGSFTLEMKR